MLFEKLDVGSILQTIHSTGLANLAQVAERMGEAYHDIDVNEMERQTADKIDPRLRRYGKGAALLGPYGYFYPSELLPVMANNTSRGRLLKKDTGALYIYDFDANGNIALIDFPSMSAKSFCESKDNMKAYLTYEYERNNPGEFRYSAFMEYDDNGLLETMVQFCGYKNMQIVSEADIEVFHEVNSNERLCDSYKVFFGSDEVKKLWKQTNKSLYDALNYPHYTKETYRVIYDCKNRITDWEYLSLEHNIKEAPWRFW